MTYEVLMSDRAEQHLDKIIDYICNELCNKKAARLLLDNIDQALSKLGDNPYIYARISDFTSTFEYRKAVLLPSKYIVIYRIDATNRTVNIVGVFHSQEYYKNKL